MEKKQTPESRAEGKIEASTANQQQNDSNANKIVGQLLSILTKVQCRYEGVVEAVDKTEKTITLKSVRSFGTEGRKGGAEEVPPSETVHAKVKFRLDFLVKFDIIKKTQATSDPAIISQEEEENGEEQKEQAVKRPIKK